MVLVQAYIGMGANIYKPKGKIIMDFTNNCECSGSNILNRMLINEHDSWHWKGGCKKKHNCCERCSSCECGCHDSCRDRKKCKKNRRKENRIPDGYTKCTDTDGTTSLYKIADRDRFWPCFASPRYVSCSCLYNGNMREEFCR